MSLSSQIKGFTVWFNTRTKHEGIDVESLVPDFLLGPNFMAFVKTVLGRHAKGVGSFDGLTNQQKQTRIEWSVKELRFWGILPPDREYNCRMMSLGSANELFDFLWIFVVKDLRFLWERLEFFQLSNDEKLVSVPFRWVPDPPPVPKKKEFSVERDLLSGFGSTSYVYTELKPEDDHHDDKPGSISYNAFPEVSKMTHTKKNRPKKTPSGINCLLEIINTRIQSLSQGKKLQVKSLSDLSDDRILLCLVNSFIPHSFPAEVLLVRDRFTLNLILRTSEKCFRSSSQFDSEDLVECEDWAMGCYFAAFLLSGFHYQQSMAALRHLELTKQIVRETEFAIEILPKSVEDYVAKYQKLQETRKKHRSEIKWINRKYDITFCEQWRIHVGKVISETHRYIRERITRKFEIIIVPRNIAINELCEQWKINMVLTNGNGYYQLVGREDYSDRRKVICRVLKSEKFIDNFISKNSDLLRKLLHLPNELLVELSSEGYPYLQIFMESLSKNKQLKMGSLLLYQIFPASHEAWQRSLRRLCLEGNLEQVKSLINLFKPYSHFVNSQDPKTGDTALHCAATCPKASFDLVHFLLERGASIDQRNKFGCTPLFSAIEAFNLDVARLLIEWGCNVHILSVASKTAFEACKDETIRTELIDVHNRYSTLVPKIVNGNLDILMTIVNEHEDRMFRMSSLNSRCISGSTILHSACHFGDELLVKRLLCMRISANLEDYKGSPPLHRAKSTAVIKILLEFGAVPTATDEDNNNALHVKCFGEKGDPTDLDSIEFLLEIGLDPTTRNNKGFMPIHCAAMQGRTDAIQLLLKHDSNSKILNSLMSESTSEPPSMTHLAIANDFIDCAQWLLKNEFNLKEGEPDQILNKIISGRLEGSKPVEALKFVLECGANSNQIYNGGNTTLHYAAVLENSFDIIKLLLDAGADVDSCNDENCTPLFFTVQANNMPTSALLLAYGAEPRLRNLRGLTPFDYIQDYDDWVQSGYFNDETVSRLKAFKLKHVRDLVRAISRRVKFEKPAGLATMRVPDMRRFSSAANNAVTEHLALPAFEEVDK